MRFSWMAGTGLVLAAGASAAIVGAVAFRADARRNPEAIGTAAYATSAARATTAKVDPVAPGTITTIAGNGVEGFSGDGGPALQAMLAGSDDIAVDAAGNVFFEDNGRVRKVTPAGVISTYAGTGVLEWTERGKRPTGDNGPATQARFWAISGLATDRAGNLYIADSDNYRIRRVGTDGIIRTIAGIGEPPSRTGWPVPFGGEGGQATSARLSYPGKMTTDAAGNLYVHDHDHIRKITPAGVITTIAGNGGTEPSGDGGPARLAAVNASRGLASDNAGNLYLGSSYGNVVRRISADGIITTVAGGGEFEVDPVARNLDLLQYTAMTADAQGNVYVLRGHTVMRVSPAGLADTIVGTNIADDIGIDPGDVDGGPATRARLIANDLVVDAAGNVFITDHGYSRVRKVTPTPPMATPVGLNAFHPAEEMPVGGWNKYGVVADINGDRRDDLVVVVDATLENMADNQDLRIYQQGTNGALALTTRISTPPHSQVLAADYNRDGRQDLVVWSAWRASLGLSTASGLQWRTLVQTGTTGAGVGEPRAVDINSDGTLDLCLEIEFAFKCLRGDGRGGLAAPTAAMQGTPGIGSPIFTDLSGDGAVDLIFGSDTYFNREGILARINGWLWLSRGDRGHGDFNGDGRLDVLTPDFAIPGESQQYLLAHQDATGGFETAVPQPTYRVPMALLGADMNNDGLDDVLTAHQNHQGVGYMAQKNGRLDVEVRYPFPAGTRWVVQPSQPSLAAGDLNGDGCPDAVMFDFRQSVLVYRGRNCRPPQIAHDIDGDRRADVIWRNGTSGANDAWRAATAAMRLPLTAVANTQWTISGIGDFSGDGKADLLWRNGVTGANELWRSASSTLRQSLAAEPNVAWRVAGVGDFDNDGRQDLFWRNSATGQNGIWFSANRATSQSAMTWPDQNWQVAGIGDFTGDAKDDVLWRNKATGANELWPSGQYAQRLPVTAVTSLSWSVAAVADFNGDRIADILWRNSSGGANVLWLYGRATAQRAVATVVDTNWQVAATADFDGDGKADIFWRNKLTGGNELWSEANVKFRKVLTPVTNTAWQVMPR